MVRTLLIGGALLGAIATAAQAPAAVQAQPSGQNALPPGFTVTQIFDNPTATAIQLALAPGAKEQPHQHPYAMLVVYTARADVQMQNGDTNTRATRQPGDVDFIGRNVTHWAANVGSGTAEATVIAIKADRPSAGPFPPPQPLPGLTRSTLLDQAEATINRVELASGAREPVHMHPYDLIVVVPDIIRMDIMIGDMKESKEYDSGATLFVPRNTPHAFGNLETRPIALVTVAPK
jgi:quercetin dioxygenase-like cupin family protein